jgi:hypothetical protein
MQAGLRFRYESTFVLPGTGMAAATQRRAVQTDSRTSLIDLKTMRHHVRQSAT